MTGDRLADVGPVTETNKPETRSCGFCGHEHDCQPPRRVVRDGYGNEWLTCERHECYLHVVRPGKVQCSCD